MGGSQRLVGEPPEDAETVLHADDDNVVGGGKRGAVVLRVRR